MSGCPASSRILQYVSHHVFLVMLTHNLLCCEETLHWPSSWEQISYKVLAPIPNRIPFLWLWQRYEQTCTMLCQNCLPQFYPRHFLGAAVVCTESKKKKYVIWNTTLVSPCHIWYIITWLPPLLVSELKRPLEGALLWMSTNFILGQRCCTEVLGEWIKCCW